MSAADKRVSQSCFEVVTSTDPQAIRSIARTAAAHGGTFLGSRLDEQADTNSGLDYAIKGPGGLVTQMTFTLSWVESGDARWVVTLQPHRYLTTRPTIFMIPVGPVQVPALPCLETFAARVREELAP